MFKMARYNNIEAGLALVMLILYRASDAMPYTETNADDAVEEMPSEIVLIPVSAEVKTETTDDEIEENTSSEEVSTETTRRRGLSCNSYDCAVDKMSRFFFLDNCSPVYCVDNCYEIVMNTDNCPICRCEGFSSKEYCFDGSSCSQNGTCQDHFCRYAPVPDTLPKACSAAFQCAVNQSCIDFICVPEVSNRTHLIDLSCWDTYQCPNGYTCEDSTCWQDIPIDGVPSKVHLEGVDCAFDHNCPTLYACDKSTCIYTGIEHGGECFFDRDCPANQTCTVTTCY